MNAPLKISGRWADEIDTSQPVPVAIHYWYDRHERTWVTTLRDADGNQIGDADYDGRKVGRDKRIEWWKHEFNTIKEVKHLTPQRKNSYG